MSYVEIGVSSLDRSGAFYSTLLGFPAGKTSQDESGHRVLHLGPAEAEIRLVELGAAARPTDWDLDDLQRGIRHFGMKVADIDSWAGKLARADVEFALEPLDAFGDVRIAFFFDPDGAYLELVQGYVQHTNLWSAALAQAEVDGDADWDGTPRFDHVAITVPDLDEALAFYAGGLGFGRIGQLVRPGDERGFGIANLRAGPGVLEVFTYDEPTYDRDGTDEPDRLGLRAIGISGRETLLGPGNVPLKGTS
jgi:catechol 2,3-dioxygenase-like lactoylglutathione lyase family enzyme